MAGEMNALEAACVYAALALKDDGVEITSAKIDALLNASGVQGDGVFSKLFAKALKGVDADSLIKAISSGVGAGGGGGGAAPAAAAAAAPAKEEAKKEENKKKEESEEEDEDMGFGLFD